MKYLMQVEIDAEQYLPEKDKIPAGVMSDGPRNPREDKRSSWVLRTKDGTSYLNDGDYVVTQADGTRYIVPAEVFEKNYKLMED